MSVKPIPDGYHTVTPYLIVDGASAAIDFYKKAFGAEELERHGGPGGKIMHAEIKIGDSRVMLADEFPEMGHRGPKSLGGTATGMCLYVRDVDTVWNRAVAAGATIVKPLANQFYGDRSGMVQDPFGHRWNVSTHVEDVSPEEMGRRMAAMHKQNPGGNCGS
jgi:PhnB protein